MGGVNSVYVRSAPVQNDGEKTEDITTVDAVEKHNGEIDVDLLKDENLRLRDDNRKLLSLLRKIEGDTISHLDSLEAEVPADTEPANEPDLLERIGEGIENGTINETEKLETRGELHTFRAKLHDLREARRQAIAEKSREMRQLREQLHLEKQHRETLEKSLQGENLPIRNLHAETNLDAALLENQRLQECLGASKCEVSRLNAKLLETGNDLSDVQRRLKREESRRCDAEERARAVEEEKKAMWAEYDNEKEQIDQRTASLKKVVQISKDMLAVREQQIETLKLKLKEIEESVRLTQAVDLKAEYEKQLNSIKELKDLYGERNTLLESERSSLHSQMSALKEELSDLNIKYNIAAEEVDTEREAAKEMATEIANLTIKARASERELTLMNSLLTQMLIGAGPPGPGALDKLTEQLQENHALMSVMTSCETCADDAQHLPKLLLHLCAQLEERECDWSAVRDPMTDSTDDPSTLSEPSEGLPTVSYKNAKVFQLSVNQTNEESAGVEGTNQESAGVEGTNEEAAGGDVYSALTTANVVTAEDKTANQDRADPAVQEIVTNLPKVWRVLSELLSHHAVENPPGETRNCYKRVDTPDGPRTVISVSDTFIRLKELIIEKKNLVKEVTRLKHLNGHLETRLDDQEKRLLTVQSELHKTWGVVGRMRAQHHQLHNQEKILRYELQEKRIMVSELKSELVDCRDLWERARRKNNESETECNKLRGEFAARRIARRKAAQESGESGFSDDDHCDADRSSTPSPTPATIKPGEIVSETLVGEKAADLEESTPIDFNSCGETLEIIGQIVDVRTVSHPVSLELDNESCRDPVETGAVCSGVGLEVPVEDKANKNIINNVKTLKELAVIATSSQDSSENKALVETGEVTFEDTSYSTDQNKQVVPEDELLNDTKIVTNVDTGDSACALPSDVSKNWIASVSSQSTKLLDSVLSQCDLTTPDDRTTLPQSSVNNVSEDERERAREARSQRLSRLEEQCELLVRKVDITSHKSIYLSSRLEELHDHYSMPGDMENSEPSQMSSSQNLEYSTERLLRPEGIEVAGEVPTVLEQSSAILKESSAVQEETLKILGESLAILSESCTNQVEGQAPSRDDSLVLGTADECAGACVPDRHESPILNLSQIQEEQDSSIVGEAAALLSTTSAPDTPSSQLPTTRDISLATFDERMARRDERLKRLEDLSSSLHNQVSSNVARGIELSNRLTEMHEEEEKREQAKNSKSESVKDKASGSGTLGNASSQDGSSDTKQI